MESLADILKRVGTKRGATLPPKPEGEPVCGDCNGTGWVTVHVPVGDPSFGKSYQCKCQFSDLEESLDNFNLDPKYPDLSLALEATRNWLSGQGPAMLVLAGEAGVGKTHLALAARNHLNRSRLANRLITDRDLDSMIRRSFDQNTTEDLLRIDLGKQPWLIIDDFGTVARVKDSTMESHVDDLFSLRWKGVGDGLRTMITTNLSSDDLHPRIRSRFNDHARSRYMIIEAPDYRLKVTQ